MNIETQNILRIKLEELSRERNLAQVEMQEYEQQHATLQALRAQNIADLDRQIAGLREDLRGEADGDDLSSPSAGADEDPDTVNIGQV